MKQKSVLAIHDISCVGRCSITTAVPIISAAGIICSPLPTAVLSTHTGGFTGYTFRDLTEDMMPIVDHWKTLGYRFDAIYTGFLGSKEQISIVSDIFDRYPDAVKVVDPVMADEGKLYKVFDSTFPEEMKKLCSKADVLMPNITEACLVLGREYEKGPYTPEYVDDLMERLTELGAKKIILTGVFFEENKLGAATYDSESNEKSYYLSDRIPGYYHGSGDVFGSAAVASIVSGKTLSEASRIAVDFTVNSIRRTYEYGDDVRYGVDFESGIPELVDSLSGGEEENDI